MSNDNENNNTSEKLHVISDWCDRAFEELNSIKDKVQQIIDYKKKSPASGGDELIRRQVISYLDMIGKLEAVNKHLGKAAEEVKQLCQEAHLLLGKGLKASEGIGLGVGGSAPTEQEEDEDKH